MVTRFDARGNIVEANLAVIFAQPKREFPPVCTPAHRKRGSKEGVRCLCCCKSLATCSEGGRENVTSTVAQSVVEPASAHGICGATPCSGMLARNDDRWKELVRQQALRNAERSSIEHDPGRHPPIERDRSNVQDVNRWVQGIGRCTAATKHFSCGASSSVACAAHVESQPRTGQLKCKTYLAGATDSDRKVEWPNDTPVVPRRVYADRRS